MNTLTRPTLLIYKRDYFEGETVRVQHLSGVDFVRPERPVLPKFIANDARSKNGRDWSFRVEKEKVLSLQRLPDRLHPKFDRKYRAASFPGHLSEPNMME
jgi:hypothetical protein